MDKKESKELTKKFIAGLKRDLSTLPRGAVLAITYALAFLSVVSAILFLLWLYG